MCRFLILLALLNMLVGCGSSVDDDPQSADPDAVKIGLVVPLTGPVASFGRVVERSTRLAVKEVNDAGGINGQRVQLLIRDDQFDPDIAQARAQELIDLGVEAIIGPVASFLTLPTAQNVTIPAGVALVSPSATTAAITGLADNDTVYRTVVSDAFQAILLAQVMTERGVNSISIIQVDDVYGNGLGDTLVASFTGTVLSRITYPVGKESGFSTQINQLFSNGIPDAVVIIGFSLDGANITRDILSYNPQPMPDFFASDAIVSASFIANAAPDIIEGLIGTESAPPSQLDNFITYRQNLAQALGVDDPGEDVEGYSTYDAAMLAMLAMAQAGENSRQAIIANLRSVSRADGAGAVTINVGEFARALAAIAQGQDIDYEGANGSVDFDANGDIQNGFYSVVEIQRTPMGELDFVQIDSRPVPF